MTPLLRSSVALAVLVVVLGLVAKVTRPADIRATPAATLAAPDDSDACPDAGRLARRYAPALALAPDDQAPRPVEMFLERARLEYRDGDRRVAEPAPNAARLADLADRPEAFLALPPAVDDVAGQRRLYEQAVAADRGGRYRVTAYAAVYCDANSADLAGRTVIQYWLFYLYNDFYNKHEGDWELIQVVLDPSGRPDFAAYAQHNTYTWRDWDEVLVEVRPDPDGGPAREHPRVYVARGSHASYFQYAAGGYGGDVVVDARDFVIPDLQLLPRSKDTAPAAFAWLRFPGAWGERPPDRACEGCQSGPVGPAFNAGGAKWGSPLSWGGQRLTRADLVANNTARITVRGAGQVHYYDGKGRHTGPLPDGRFERAAPGVAHLARPGRDHQILLIPSLDGQATARIEVIGAGPFDIDVLAPDGGVARRYRFDAVVLGAAGRASLELGGAVPRLQVDANGDGRFERSLAPAGPEGATGRSDRFR